MKRCFALLLALAMVLTLGACAPGAQPGDDETLAPSGDEPVLSGEDLEDVGETLDILEFLIPEGWDKNPYGAYIYNVWDGEFLTDCFPAAPEGIKADQTTFKDYDHNTLNGDYSVGPLWWESYGDYRVYGVSFYATAEQLTVFLSGVEANGLTGGLTE